MNNILARVALSSIIAVIGGVALINVSSSPSLIIGWWLVYAVSTGVALAPRSDEAVLRTVAMAAFPAIVPILDAAVIQVITGHSVPISGAQLSVKIAAVIFVVDWIGVWLFSYAHQLIMKAIESAQDKDTVNKLKNIEKAVRAAALCVGSIALAIAAMGYTTNH